MNLESTFPILLISLINAETALLDLTKVGSLFQMKDPRKFPCFVLPIVDLAGEFKSASVI